MRVLIVESNPALGQLWEGHLRRFGLDVALAQSQDSSIDIVRQEYFNVIVLNLVLGSGSALAVADYVSYRWPDTRIIFVTNSTFFSDGSIFNHSPNACAFVTQTTAPEDLAAMVDHYAH
ncbi:MAG: response regulator transcription factor [Planktomarina sp.]